jgi:hypothetical protein
MKFCRPIFRSAAQASKENTVAAFERKKNEFHPIARKLIEKVRSLPLNSESIWSYCVGSRIGITGNKDYISGNMSM